jgi:hypothetical protein
MPAHSLKAAATLALLMTLYCESFGKLCRKPNISAWWITAPTQPPPLAYLLRGLAMRAARAMSKAASPLRAGTIADVRASDYRRCPEAAICFHHSMSFTTFPVQWCLVISTKMEPRIVSPVAFCTFQFYSHRFTSILYYYSYETNRNLPIQSKTLSRDCFNAYITTLYLHTLLNAQSCSGHYHHTNKSF